MRKSSSESSEKLLSVDDVISQSGQLKLIGQFSRDCIGCKTRVKFFNSNWSVLIRLLLVKLSRSVCGLFIGFANMS